MRKSLKNRITLAVIFIGIAFMLFFELGESKLFFANADWICRIFSRVFGGIVCLALMIRLDFTHLLFGHKKGAFRRLVIILPCFAVAVNNFPFLSVIMKDAYLSPSISEIILYACFCISVGFFEETAFRGCVFPAILGRMQNDKLSVLKASLLSSAFFGIVHIVNLFAGASFGSVALQIAYSFLIGALCSILLVKTANIWTAVAFHAIYNFAGGLVAEFGSGKQWTLPTIILTAVVGVIIAVYTLVLWYKIDEKDVLYLKQGREEKNRNV